MEHRAGEVPVAKTQILEVIFRLDFAGTDLSVGRGNMDLDAGERAKRAMALRQLPKPGGKRMGGGANPPHPKKKGKKEKKPPTPAGQRRTAGDEGGWWALRLRGAVVPGQWKRGSGRREDGWPVPLPVPPLPAQRLQIAIAC